MKKCNRCQTLLNWNRHYCPLCGGVASEAASVHTVTPVSQVSAPAPDPIQRTPVAKAPTAAAVSVSEEILVPETLDVPAAASIQHGSSDAPTKQTAPDKIELSGDIEPPDTIEPTSGSISRSNTIGISDVVDHQSDKIEISGPIDAAAGATIERRPDAAASARPQQEGALEPLTPTVEPVDGEFLKMFPNARPD